MSGQPHFDKVAVIGLGLIGSSLCHVMKRDGLAGTIAGNARSKTTLETATKIGFIDSAHQDPTEAVSDADLIVLAAPVGANGKLAEAIAPALKPGAIVTDVGSVKVAVIRDVLPHLPDGVHLVPGHPVAGTEHSGPESGFPELFDNRYCILTPPDGADADAVAKIEGLWKAAGSIVEVMDAEHHDRVLAITSHLPHLIAYTIVGTASDLEGQLREKKARDEIDIKTAEVIKYSAGGFRDFTRIAASDPVMWRDIFLNNKDAVLELLGRFIEDLTAMQRAIRWDEGETLEDTFEQRREIRRSVIEMGQAGSFNPTETED
ncbi:MAG TPA: prephenate/arogenate dehydrogenase family protein [Rhodospirillaceae bacterium]|nr:cyclohexadienyl dehydrogenase [Rhodospirillaceae bacterium]MBL25322.1 cyclohexadienyl dehydrogenase [Rhodospirillaceae bacterium]HAT34180.1 prephenate/arogenate dehydrogenase family protein [Rhodospirillaceae bacterium]